MNEQVLILNHEIRQIEHALNTARRRRRWSNLSLVFGPVLAILLYVAWWLPIDGTIITAVYIPAVPIVVAFCVSSYHLKRNPGGFLMGSDGTRVRIDEGELELRLAQKKDTRKFVIANAEVDTKVRRITYKEDAYSDIEQLRVESRRYRRLNNILQGFLIIGSLAATGASGVATELPILRWATLIITFLVGISSGFMGYFKFKERSFYLQQTADAIEQEWEAVEVGVGRYKRIDNEDERLAEFVEEVHRLKAEQMKRQQNLEQSSESRDQNE